MVEKMINNNCFTICTGSAVALIIQYLPKIQSVFIFIVTIVYLVYRIRKERAEAKIAEDNLKNERKRH